ncbi:hypothetical protein XA68_14473 [Ophiocordyceps unilateralis]|uniref:Cell cycle control protein n=1 Tax=Ophiocordyceps unilateralis TaxID=268505 RepID=A0A2A9P9G7_OPHUN|nr:hypothetical protein XA68_14473 [Ophiocordyceps unilateralis]
MPAGGLELGSDDDLVEIGASPRRPGSLHGMRDSRSSTLLPVGLRPSSRPDQQRSRQLGRQDGPAAVIDLTNEPDSPEGPRSQQTLGRNPRRTNSQNVSPPHLSRTDSTLISPFSSVIDLTVDSPEDQRQPESPRLLRPRHTFTHHHHHHRHHHHHPHQHRPPRQVFRQFVPDQLIEVEFLNSGGVNLLPDIAMGVQRMTAGLIGADVWRRGGFNPPSFEFAAAAAAAASFGNDRDPSPKPPMEQVLPAREGFTRDTQQDPEGDGAGIVVCPACNEELAYDPTDNSARGGDSKKRRRVPGEHHFWALKKCGHVYCADCFENRKPTKAMPNGAGFRSLIGKSPGSASTLNELRCVVTGCETKIAHKTEWVGIFL